MPTHVRAESHRRNVTMIQKKQTVEHALSANVLDLLYQSLETELCGVEIGCQGQRGHVGGLLGR